jgi:hypothetical protein
MELNNLTLKAPYSGDISQGEDKDMKTMFESNSGEYFSSTIREHIQNSIDAKSDNQDTVIVTLTRKKMNLSFYPFEELSRIIDLCIEKLKFNARGSEAALKEITTYHMLKEIKDRVKNLNPSSVPCVLIEDNCKGINGETRFPNFTEGKTRAQELFNKNESVKDIAESSKLGAFGVGKFTAFLISDLLTVFYDSSFKGKRKFIGYSKLISYIDKQDNDQIFAPNVFYGSPNPDYKNESDWHHYQSEALLRTVNGDGLTTVIPNFETEDISWAEKVKFYGISSFFQKIFDGSLEIVVNDEIHNNHTLINSKTVKKTFLQMELTDEIKNENEIEYLLTKTFVDGENDIYQKTIEEIDINIKKGFEGKLTVEVYKNQELAELLENKSYDLKKNFRIVRQGMLTRDVRYPKKVVPSMDLSICGFVYFKDSPKLEGILNLLETQSHDSHSERRIKEKNRIDPNFPSVGQVRRNFITPISKGIREIILKYSDLSFDENETYDFTIDDIGFESDSEKKESSYFRTITLGKKNVEKTKEKSFVPKLSISGDGNMHDSSVSDNQGEDGEILSPTFRLGGDGTRNTILPPSENRPTEVMPSGDKKGKVQKGSSNVRFVSKLEHKKGNKSRYLISLLNLSRDVVVDISLKQQSVQGQNYTSFKLTDFIDFYSNKKYTFLPSVSSKYRIPVGYRINKVGIESKQNKFIVDVVEPTDTLSVFQINFTNEHS